MAYHFRLNIGSSMCLSLLLLAACNNSAHKVVVAAADTVSTQNKQPKSLTSYWPKIDYKKLKGNWIPVSEHYGDTAEIQFRYYRTVRDSDCTRPDIYNYLGDTAYYNYKSTYLLTFDADSACHGKWHYDEGDLLGEGNYYESIDKDELYMYGFLHKIHGGDSVYHRRIIYLDDKYMLLAQCWGRKKIAFYIKTKMQHGTGGG